MHEIIIEKIKNAGVVGAGGAGFPTHVKVSANAEYVIVNGAECEPLIKVDQQLMDVMADKVVQGLLTVMEITGAQKGIIALKGKYKEAINSLEKEIKGKPIDLFILQDFYPAGDEQVTVYEVLGRVVPEGGIPLKVGCVVTNVETLINIVGALAEKSVTDTYLTITGNVPDPVTVKLPIGTPVVEAVKLAGRNNLQGMTVIDGGPMMGKIVEDFLQPITKTTKALIVLPIEHPLVQKRVLPMKHIVKQSKAACIQCRRCTDLCPRYLLGHNLEPHKIMRSLNYASNEVETMKMAFLCSECGACEQYACPMFLSPRRVNAALKSELAKKGIKGNATQETPTVRVNREFVRIPVKRLKIQLGLTKYDHPAPLRDVNYSARVVRIPLTQHVGKPSIPAVNIGQSVKKGDLIATVPDEALGASIHASISGTVKEISDYIVIEREGGSK
ncbi:MAG: hypothetical protein PWQ96_1893 [Clostridia bacterium]|nr:hypothetical protein [Clostridia bacterium]